MAGNNNTIVTKTPPVVETIGAQYYCFNNPGEGVDFDVSHYEDTVTKEETVKSVTVTENMESTPIYASGKTYKTINNLAYVDIQASVLAHDADDLAKMRGDLVDNSGLIQTPTTPNRPYFGYGKVVKLSGGKVRFDWYPKCQLVEDNDEVKTKEQNFSEQNKTLTIRAYTFDEAGTLVKNSVDSSSAKFPAGLTEEKFFSKVIVTKTDLTSVNPIQGA